MVRPVTTRRARVAENYENLSPLDVNCQKGDRWMPGFFKTHRDEKDDYHVIMRGKGKFEDFLHKIDISILNMH